MDTPFRLYTLTSNEGDGAVAIRFQGNDVFCSLQEYTAADLARFEAVAQRFYMHTESEHVTWVGRADPTRYSTENEWFRALTLSDLLICNGEPVGAVLPKEAIAADFSGNRVSRTSFLDEDEYYDHSLSLRRLLPPENYMGPQTGIRTYTVAAGITVLPAKAFQDWRDLEEVTLPEGLTCIDAAAFEGCRQLKRITLPDSLISIGRAAFRNCVNLEQVTIPEGVTQLDDEVFSGCTALKRLSLPASLNRIGTNTFPVLTMETVQVVHGSFAEAFCRENYIAQYSHVTLPEGTTAITEGQFANVPLRSIHLPEGLLTIGEDAFCGCTALQKITLPASLEQVQAHAFSRCNVLEEVTILNPRCEFHRTAFSGHTRLRLLIPSGTDLIQKLNLPFSSGIRYDLIGGGSCQRNLHYIIERYSSTEDTAPVRILFDCGSRYNGQLKNEKYEGTGTFTDGKGFQYTGTFQSGLFHGSGKITYADGEVLEGEFRNGWPCNARGVFRYRDQIRLQGSWSDGIFTGSGVFRPIRHRPEPWEPECAMSVPEPISGELKPQWFPFQTLEGAWENGLFTGTTCPREDPGQVIRWIGGTRQQD